MARPRGTYQDVYETAPVEAGLTVVAVAAVAVNVVAFFEHSRVTVLLALFLATVALVGGSLFQLRVWSAWSHRNERHRTWLATKAETDMLDLRSQLDARERRLERARQDWVRPLCAAFALTLSAVIVPYVMVSSIAPDPLVEPLNAAWATIALTIGLGNAVLAVLAGRRQERASRAPDARSMGTDRHVDA